MSYLILCDSCTDFTEDMKQDPHFAHIPLTIHIGDYDIIDDDTFDQQDFLRRIDAYPECAKSSCPAPDEYLKPVSYTHLRAHETSLVGSEMCIRDRL